MASQSSVTVECVFYLATYIILTCSERPETTVALLYKRHRQAELVATATLESRTLYAGNLYEHNKYVNKDR